MAYREPAALEPPARRAALATVLAEIEKRRSEHAEARARAEEARAEADALAVASDREVAALEEERRRALLLALATAPESAETQGLRAALRAERRDRDLRAALERARSLPPRAGLTQPSEPLASAGSPRSAARAVSERPSLPVPPAAATPDVRAAQDALRRAREARARALGPALARAEEAAARVRDLERAIDELERDLARLQGPSQP